MKTTLGLAVALVALSPPARDGSQEAVSGTATSPDRIPIRYHAAGKGDPALVFVHCGGCERGFWDRQVAHFAAKHRVVALDLAGHGQSGGGRKDWTIAAFGQDVVSVVEALGLKRVVLIGHSLGGPVVLEAARRMPGRVAGLVLVDTLVDFEQKRPSAEEMEKSLSELEANYRANLTAYVSHQSRGMPVTTGEDKRLDATLETGRALYTRRIGQLNLSCANCHDENWGQKLGSAPIPQAHPTGYPIYRLEWQGMGSLQRRMRNCMIGVRAESYAYGAPEFTALELYLMSRARGMTMETPGVRP